MWLINIHKNHNSQTEFRVFNSANVVDEIECVNEKGLEEIILQHAIHKAVVVINGFGIYQSKKPLVSKNDKFFIQKYAAHNEVLYTAIKVKEAVEIIFLLSNLGVSVTNVFIGDALGVNILTSNIDETSFGDTTFSVLHNGEMKMSKNTLNSNEYTHLLNHCVQQISNRALKSRVHFEGILLRLLLIVLNAITGAWSNRKWFVGTLVVLVALIYAAKYGYETTLDKNERAFELEILAKDIEQNNAIKHQSIVGNLKGYNVDRAQYLSVLFNDIFSDFPKEIEVKYIDAFPELKRVKGQNEIGAYSNSLTIEGMYADFVEFETWVSNINALPGIKQVVYNDFKKIKGENNFSISIVLTKNVN